MTIDERIIDQTLFSDLDEIEASLCYIEDWIKAITELRAAREVVFFSRLLIDSVVRYEDGDVTISSSYSAALQDSLMRYDEARRG